MALCTSGLLAACSGDLTTPQGPSGSRQVSAAPPPGPPNKQVERTKLGPARKRPGRIERRRDPFPSADRRQPAERAKAKAAADGKGSADETPERDYGQELEARMASAASCVEPRTEDALGEVRVSLQAYVTSTGRITRGSVSAPGLSAEERACMQRRLEHTSLPGGIDNAPRSVRGTLVLEPAPEPVAR